MKKSTMQHTTIIQRNKITSCHIFECKMICLDFTHFTFHICELYIFKRQGPVVQSVVSLTSSIRAISLTVLADSIYNILIFFTDVSKKFQHICVSLDVNFNKSLTNDVVSFEQLGPVVFPYLKY